ncbi:MAG: NAD-dependent DNA ligase LigA [Bacteroidales bacterium]|nr:NAD-dependent DNA ligase LigA [Bacteroidales bacterium]
MEALREELSKHNYNYYVLNAPTVSDFEFDIKMQELETLEKMFPQFASEDSPTQHVGSDIEKKQAKGFEQVAHRYPMLSLGNTYNIDELNDFNDRIAKLLTVPYSFSCELKFDGTAICLTYKNGILDKAVTRGDGIKGDNVIDNVLTIKSIPQRLKGSYPDEFEIRGEIFMPWDDFYRLNAEKEDNDEPAFANPRNAAAGSLKLLDSEIVAERGLDCVLYHILGENLPFSKHSEAIEAAAGWGLPISKYSEVVNTIEEVKEYIEKWDTDRKTLPFATDGIVIKVNELDSQRKLGYTAKSPRWATAYKFKPEQALTRLLSVDYQVGRTGAITPVANLEPVPLSGTIVKRASLHNKDQMDLLDIHIGDYVYVEKGGEIIPKITAIAPEKRPADASVPDWPLRCPDCGALLVRDESQAKHYCPNNTGCPTQIKSGIIHFISRKAMNILAGEATVEQLYTKGLVFSLSDLYKLTEDQLVTLDGWKEKSAQNFLESIENSKKTPFFRVLYALGIRHVGENTAKMLARHFKSIDALSSASKEELLQIDEVGEIMADSILSYFDNPVNQELIKELKEIGLQFEENEDGSGKVSDRLAGATVVVSGVFSVSREEIKAMVEANGGKNSGSVSGKTSFILAGDKPGAEKIKKAEKLGIRIVSEDEFYKMIED